MMDMITDGRRTRPHVVHMTPPSHYKQHPGKKLSQKDVIAMRQLRAESNEKYCTLAALFEVDVTTVRDVVTRRTWRRLP